MKASNTRGYDRFGTAVALSEDGNTLAVGAYGEDSDAKGYRNEGNWSNTNSGAVYLFARNNGSWREEAFVKASNVGARDEFGSAIALSGDGQTLAVGAPGEDSGAQGINGDQKNNLKSDSGAVYLFARKGAAWRQKAYVKASNAEASAGFGEAVSLSGDGNTLAVGASGEDGGALGKDGLKNGNSVADSGAVYLFTRRNETSWRQQAYVKPSYLEIRSGFGASLDLSEDGNTLAVGASKGYSPEKSAAFVFSRQGDDWNQRARFDRKEGFGRAVSLDGDGKLLAVGMPLEDGSARGINGERSSKNPYFDAGAVYLFVEQDGRWRERSYVKASTTADGDNFGESAALSDDGNALVVGAPEKSGGGGVYLY